MNRWPRLIAAVALLLLLSACDAADEDNGSETPRPQQTEEATEEPEEPEETEEAADLPDETLSAAEERKIQELIDDTTTAVEVVDQFWATHWPEFFTGTYVGPVVNGGFVGSDNPPCGGEQFDGSGNAYYCEVEDYIDWDWELFAANFLDEAIGDSFVYFVIAHEWAHAVQARLDATLTTVDAELQADCLAAAALNGAVADGTLIFEPGDRGEIFQSLSVVADEVEWGDSADHGSADERIEVYQLGEEGGVEVCLPE